MSPPRRVDGLRALHAAAARGELPVVEAPAFPPAPPAEKPFDFNAYLREVRASKITRQLKGRHFSESRRGRQFADELVHHMIKGEELEIAKIKDKFTFNEIPTYEQRLSNYVAQLDSGQINHCGLF